MYSFFFNKWELQNKNMLLTSMLNAIKLHDHIREKKKVGKGEQACQSQLVQSDEKKSWKIVFTKYAINQIKKFF